MKGGLYTNGMMRSLTRNGTRPRYYGQFDIRSFFTSIDKSILYRMVRCTIQKHVSPEKRSDALWLARILIFHDPTANYQIKGQSCLLKEIPRHKSLFGSRYGKGLPIGNLTSQFFANVYLDKLDQYVKRKLRVRYYVRYVDDIVIFSHSMEEIRTWRQQINTFLKRHLKLRLHRDKNIYASVFSGLDFIGYVIFPNYLLARNQVVQNLKTRLYLFNQGLLLMSNNQNQIPLPLSSPPSKSELSHILAMVNSYYGHLRHANCYHLRRHIYEWHFGMLRKYMYPDESYQSYKLITSFT